MELKVPDVWALFESIQSLFELPHLVGTILVDKKRKLVNVHLTINVPIQKGCADVQQSHMVPLVSRDGQQQPKAGDRSLITSFENLQRALGIVKRHVGFQRVPARVMCDLKGSRHFVEVEVVFLHIHIKKMHFFSSSLTIISFLCFGCAHLFSF